jgi:hypothetical protein
MHYYLVKLAIVLALVIALKLIFNVSFPIPVPRWTHRLPVLALVVMGFLETYGWILIVAMIIASVWQIAEKR